MTILEQQQESDEEEYQTDQQYEQTDYLMISI